MTLLEARLGFETALHDSLEKDLTRSEKARLQEVRETKEVLDQLIEWSKQHHDVIQFERRTGTTQERVTFYVMPGVSLPRYTTSPFWDSYPDMEPKLSFLEDRTRSSNGTGWTEELQKPLKSHLKTLGILEKDHYPTVRFNSLRAPKYRPRIVEITQFLDGVLKLVSEKVVSSSPHA